MQQDALRAVGGVEHDAMHAMIFGHVTTQVARCAALFSLADHLARGPAPQRKSPMRSGWTRPRPTG
jgi:hypothetical protein